MTNELKPVAYRFEAIARRCACLHCAMHAGYQGVAFSSGGSLYRFWLGLN